MRFLTAYHTDVGIRKKTNQDSLLLERASTEYGDVLLAAVCDGMGGLAKGELASAALIRRLSDWFYQEFPQLLYDGLQSEKLRKSWEQLILGTNQRIAEYGKQKGISLGTTCVLFLAVDHVYYIMNIGDSRAYLLSDGLYQLTKDQTYCQREIDLGRMTPEQAAVDPQRSVLLQCVGASDVVIPDFFAGSLESGQCYLLCSDGFVHVISPQEIYQALNPMVSRDPEGMRGSLVNLTELVKARQERDNISALVLKTIG